MQTAHQLLLTKYITTKFLRMLNLKLNKILFIKPSPESIQTENSYTNKKLNDSSSAAFASSGKDLLKSDKSLKNRYGKLLNHKSLLL